MLPSNIDLTERADFGDAFLISHADLRLDDIDAGNEMSTDEYDLLVWREGIFGKKRHINQKWDIFPRINLKVAEDPHTLYCARCGKPIRIPWKNYGHHYPWKNYGLCFECNEKIETETRDRIPWRTMNIFSSRNDERGYNLFNSK